MSLSLKQSLTITWSVLHPGQVLALGLEPILVGQVVEFVVDTVGSHPVHGPLDGDRLLGSAGVLQGCHFLAGNPITGLESIVEYKWKTNFLLLEKTYLREGISISVRVNIIVS